MKTSLLKILRREEKTGKAFPKGSNRTSPNYKVISFVICLLVSFSLWLMNTLSKKYTESITFGIEYSNFPQPKSSYNSSDTMRLKINTTGFRILGYKTGVLDRMIKLDVSQFRHKENQYLYSLNNHIHVSKIEEQLGEEVKLLDISPDTLSIRPITN